MADEKKTERKSGMGDILKFWPFQLLIGALVLLFVIVAGAQVINQGPTNVSLASIFGQYFSGFGGQGYRPQTGYNPNRQQQFPKSNRAGNWEHVGNCPRGKRPGSQFMCPDGSGRVCKCS